MALAVMPVERDDHGSGLDADTRDHAVHGFESDQVPAPQPGIPDEEHQDDMAYTDGSSDEVKQPPNAPPSIDPLGPKTPSPETRAWLDEQERSQRHRRRDARSESFFASGTYRRNRLLGR